MTRHVDRKTWTWLHPVARRCRRGDVVGLLAFLVWTAMPLAQDTAPPAQDAASFGRSPTLKVKTWASKDPVATLEYPAKDWRVSGRGLASLVTMEHKSGEAAVALEYELRERPTLARLVNDTFVSIEQDQIHALHPQVKDITARILTAGERRVVMLDFTRAGDSGPERVRVYVIPIERQMFRLVCRAVPGRFGGFEPVFSHVAASFAAAPSSAGAPSS
jgi:hypothetical protein